MSTAGVAAQEIRVPLKAFLHDGPALGSLNACWGRRRELGSNFLNIHPITMAYNLKSTTQAHLTSLGRTSAPAPANGHRLAEHGPSQKPSLPPLVLPPSESSGPLDEDPVPRVTARQRVPGADGSRAVSRFDCGSGKMFQVQNKLELCAESWRGAVMLRTPVSKPTEVWREGRRGHSQTPQHTL